ncbi:MAG: hypothetical protein V3W20_13365, partial [Candidatus Neomarinimicrobiota bacterium]
QLALTEYFETYNYVQKEEEYSYDNNTSGAIIKLRQSNFTNGTVRITKPGIYIFQENIAFEPNPNNDFMPTYQQIASGQYPVGTAGAYHLGFFAAITVEANGVILDLNGKTIEQTKLHNLQQRFYANIEMANAPFIPAQGPATFSTPSNFKAGEKVLIKNGILGSSSHHGIHGNTMKDIILQNLSIEDFEVAGIALNGAINSILDTITMQNTSLNIRVLSTYSQARFIRTFLKTVPDATTINGKSISNVTTDLNAGLGEAKNAVIAGSTPSNMFGNSHFDKGYDGNVYGLVLNVNGVVVNDFIETRPAEAIGNQNIYLQNITIKNIISRPVEIIALNSVPDEGGAYGGARQVGPIGDILAINPITAGNGTYNANLLSDAQLIIGKSEINNSSLHFGTTNITDDIVHWAEDYTVLNTVMDIHGYYFVKGGDSMGHVMKGNIGLFVSAGENIRVNGFTIDTVTSKGSAVGPDASGVYQGGDARGVIVTGSKNIDLDSSVITNVTTENTNATAQEIQVLGTSTNVKKDGVSI